MKLSRKSLVLIVSVVLCAAMTISGTMAYLTDADAKVNTFTMGNVDIEVKETYNQGSVLMPGQEVTKHAWIENVGSEEAYVIMNVAVPAQRIDNDGTPEEGQQQYIEVVSPQVIENVEQHWTLMEKAQHVTIEGKDYLLYSYLYNKVLQPANSENENGKTAQLLRSITLNSGVDYDPINDCYVIVTNGKQQRVDADLVNGKVYVNGYAIQATGFDSAEAAYTAYTTQWGVTDGWNEGQILLPTVPNVHVATSAELKDAIAATDNAKIYLKPGTYTLPSVKDKTVTITGTHDTVIEMPKTPNTQINGSGSSITFEGVTVEYANHNYVGISHANEIVYKNCTIRGTQFLYASEVEFIDCNFEVSGDNYAVWTYGSTAATFTNCYFHTDGKAVLVYTEGAITATHTFNNCTFNDHNENDVEGKAAVEVGESAYGNKANYTIKMNNCTVNDFDTTTQNANTFGGTNLGDTAWGNKNLMPAERLNVIIDGIDVY